MAVDRPRSLLSNHRATGQVLLTGIGRIGTSLVGRTNLSQGASHKSVDSDVPVEPLEARDLGDSRSLDGQGTRHAGDGVGVNLRGIVVVGPQLDARERVARVAGGPGRASATRSSRGDRGRACGSGTAGSSDRAAGTARAAARRRRAGGAGRAARGAGLAARQALGVPRILEDTGAPGSAASRAGPAIAAALGPGCAHVSQKCGFRPRLASYQTEPQL